MHLLRSVNMDNDQYQMGRTKIFVKNPESVWMWNVTFYFIYRKIFTWLQDDWQFLETDSHQLFFMSTKEKGRDSSVY